MKQKSPPLNQFEIAIQNDGKLKNLNYARCLYRVLENNGVYDKEDGSLVADYGMRQCAGTIAQLRGLGESYMDFYYARPKEDLTPVLKDLERLGFVIGEHPAYREDYQYSVRHGAYIPCATRKKLYLAGGVDSNNWVEEEAFRKYLEKHPDITIMYWRFEDESHRRIMQSVDDFLENAPG